MELGDHQLRALLWTLPVPGTVPGHGTGDTDVQGSLGLSSVRGQEPGLRSLREEVSHCGSRSFRSTDVTVNVPLGPILVAKWR